MNGRWEPHAIKYGTEENYKLKAIRTFTDQRSSRFRKTTVSVYRIPFLLNHYCFLPDDAILMVTFNKTLSNYIRYLYEKIDEEEKIDLFNLISEDEGKVQIATVDSLIYKYFCKYKDKNKLN